MDTKTKEDLRKAAVQAVAQRIAAEHAAEEELRPRRPHLRSSSRKRRPAVDVPSGNGHIAVSPTAVLTFGTQKDDLAFVAASTLTFQPLVLGDTDQGQVEFKIPVTWKFPPVRRKQRRAIQAMEGKGLAQYIAVHHQHGQAGAAISGVAEPTHRRPELRRAWRRPDRAVASYQHGHDVRRRGATLTPTIQFQEQVALADNKAGDTVTGGGGWTIPIIGVDLSGQVTHDVGKGHQEQTQATITNSYTLSFTAKVVLPKPETVVPSTAPPLVVLFWSIPRHRVRRGRHHQVVQGARQEAANLHRVGQDPVNLLGKASATGSLEHNRQLAHRRAGKVKDILADLAGSDVRFHIQAPGKSQAKRQGEDSTERVVEVTVGDDRRRPTRARHGRTGVIPGSKLMTGKRTQPA